MMCEAQRGQTTDGGRVIQNQPDSQNKTNAAGYLLQNTERLHVLVLDVAVCWVDGLALVLVGVGGRLVGGLVDWSVSSVIDSLIA